MATLEQLERALVNADKAGDADAARKLAAVITRARQDSSNRIPGNQVQPVPEPEPSMGEKMLGAGEALLTAGTGAIGGTLGMLGAGGAQVVRDVAGLVQQGRAYQPEQSVAQAAMQGAQALTYEPRTQAGRDYVEEVVTPAAQGMIPIGAVAPALAVPGARSTAPARVVARAGAEGAARDLAGVAGPAAADLAATAVSRTIDTAGRVASAAKAGATTLPRRALAALSRDEAATPTPGTLGSVGAAGTDMAAQRRALAADLPVPLQLTKGQASRDPAQLKFEVETAKLPEAGTPLRQRLVEQNQRLLRNFDTLVDQTGAEAPNLRAVGTAVDRALVKQMATDKAAVRTAYKAAEAAGELEQPLQLGPLVQHLNESAPDAATAPLLDVARRRALQLGIAIEDPSGQLLPQPTTLKMAETYRQAISRATDYEATNVRQATIIKSLIDENTEGLGGDLYKRARGMRRRFAQNYEDRAAISQLLATKRGTKDRRVAFEDVFEQTVLKGSLDDVRNVRRVLQRSGPDGAQAWRELQGQTASWIRDQAARNSATDSLGNRVVSVDALDKAIRSLDADGRLTFIFGKRGGQTMRDLRDLAQIARTVPPEAAVNTSNTASALLAGFIDVGTSSLSGVPLPIATMVRVVRQHVKDAALRRRIEDALQDLDKKHAPGKRRPPLVAPSQNETVH